MKDLICVENCWRTHFLQSLHVYDKPYSVTCFNQYFLGVSRFLLKMFWRFTCNIFLPHSVASHFNKRPLNCIPPFPSHVCLRCYCLHVGVKAFSCVYSVNGASRFFFFFFICEIVSMYIQVAAKVEETPNHTGSTK